MSLPDAAKLPTADTPHDREPLAEHGCNYIAWCWALLAVLPYWLPYAAHFALANGEPTGFLYYDMSYYAANGRAVFERGNGLAGPNPYDSSPDAPSIYFHWFTWLLGFGAVKLGFDPGLWFISLGAVGGLVCSRLTSALVRAVLPTAKYGGPLFLLAMWGGGLLVAPVLVVNLATGTHDDLLRFDPFEGEWSLYWGRTLTMPTEAAYHALVAAAWLAVVRGFPIRALVWAALLAATHPFSGIQLLATLGAWWVCRASNWRSQSWRAEGLLLGVISAAFLGYYFVFLEQFPQHREIRQLWTLDWNTPLLAQALAYGPILLLAVIRIRRTIGNGESLPLGTRFLLVAAAVSFALSNHHWVVRPHQPLHFTRGYVWLPILLIGLAELQRWAASRGGVGAIGLAIVLAISSADNFVYLAHVVKRAPDTSLPADEWDMQAFLRDRRERGLLVSEVRRVGYLAATYTSVRPHIGHDFMTPQLPQRSAELDAWLQHGGPAPWLKDADLVLLRRATFANRRTALGLDPPAWEVIHENSEFVLLQRVGR